jgi:type IV pilus assembly protein PilN
MIRINLLPVKEDKYAKEATDFLIIFVVAMSVVLVLLVLNSRVLAEKEKESMIRIQEADKEIANLKVIMGEIKSLKEKKADLQRKMDMIVRLQEQNVGPVRVFDELSLKLPSSKIWLEKLALRGNRVDIDGFTLENQEVANFMNQLENSMFFSGINLRKVSKDKAVRGVQTLTYNLNANVHPVGRSDAAKKSAPAEEKQ